MIQKWIANFPLGNESWADIRRTGYPKILPCEEGADNSHGQVPLTGPSRMKFPQEEYTSNAENVNYAVANLLGGPDSMTTKLWFDCK